LSDAVEKLESVFQKSGELMYMDNVRARLLQRLGEAVKDNG
jgi:hypothetical protein